MAESKSLISSAQPSLSEWLAAIDHADAEALRQEDMTKRDRLETLRQMIGIEYDRVTAFPAVDFFARTPEVLTFIEDHHDDLCALRLVPTIPELPKLRTRGRSLHDSLGWLEEQADVNPSEYNVEFVEHSDTARWSTIFVVREDGIFGEIVDGLHYQLTQGNVEQKNISRAFLRTSDGVWQWSEYDADAEAHMKDILEAIRVTDQKAQARLHEELTSEFTSEGYLMGYFETLLWPTKLIFIDYNRELHKLIAPPSGLVERGKVENGKWEMGKEGETVQGIPASRGEAEGVVRIVTEENLDEIEFNAGDILVTDNTDVRYLGLMRMAGAIVTDRGGMLSHAAITARELGVPCVVGCGDATEKLVDGQHVRVDAERGTVQG